MGMNFTAMTVSAEEADDEIVMVDAGYLDEYIIQKGGSPSSYQSEASQSVSRAATADVEGAKTAIIQAIRDRKETLNISAYNIPSTDMAELSVSIINYNPDLFYAGISKWGYSPSTQCVTTVYFRYEEQSIIDAYNEALNKAYAEALPNESGMTDLQKARALHDYLAQHVEYDLTYSKYTPYYALVEGTAVCEGYTLAYAALLHKAGIEFDYCENIVLDHIWNYVKIDGKWYHVDVTWDDPIADKTGYVSHLYFMTSDSKFADKVATSYQLRTCNDTSYDNAWWTSASSAIFYDNGNEYYLKTTNENTSSQKINLICRTGNTEKTICTKDGVWHVWGNSNGWWYTMGASLSYYEGILYFNDTLNVYANIPGSTSVSTAYSYINGDGYLFGSLVCGDKIKIDVAQSPNETAIRKTVALTVPFNRKDGTITNKNYTTSYDYNGSAIPAPTAANFTTTAGTLSFEWYSGTTKLSSEPVKAGTYTLKVKAAGTATVKAVEKDFTITIVAAQVETNVYRIFGPTRYETSLVAADALKEKLGVTKFDAVIVADGGNFADALAGSYLASVKDAPILMANNKDPALLKDYISKNLKSGGTIYILGGTSAVKQSVEDAIAPYGTVIRLGGSNRYATNILILEEAGVAKEDIIVCTGNDFADSLSASALGKPILLVKNKLNAEQKTYLESLAENKYYIVGGENAVSASVANEMKAYGSVERIGGANRYETSVMVAEKFFKNPQSAVLAYAKNFPDGLSGGPLAMSKNGPLILTMTGKDSIAAEYTKSNSIKAGIVFGGEGLISDAAVKNIFSADKVEVWK